MRSFTDEYLRGVPGATPRQLRDMKEQLEQVLTLPLELRDIMPHLFRQLRENFPVHHLLMSFSLPIQEESCVFFHPPRGGEAQDYTLRTTSEQRYTLRNTNDPCVVYIGDQSDHSIVIGLLRQLFPDAKFSVLLFSVVNQFDIVCVLAMVCKNANAYTEQHAAQMNLLRSLLLKFFDKVCLWHVQNRKPLEELPYLPLTALPGMRSVTEQLWSVARQDCPILLLGETGTGKEIVANTIYRASPRIYGPFIKLNCGGISPSLIDSELFGHEQGAFTDAINTVPGRFEQAHQGVLLLDEIGELSPLAQTRLLRVLQEGTLSRVGGRNSIEVDVRIIAATHRHLPEMMSRNEFREDLYYRLNVFTLYIPALRERPEDIPSLLRYFIKDRCARHSWKVPEIDRANLEALCSYRWPGNIRELRNAVERALIVWGGNMHVPLHIVFGSDLVTAEAKQTGSGPVAQSPPQTHRLESLDEAVAAHIRRALALSGGKISGPGGAAELLQIHPNTLRAKIQKLLKIR